MKRVSILIGILPDDDRTQFAGLLPMRSETFDLETLIGTSQEAEDGCNPCEFGTELLGLIINMSKELD